MASTVPVAHPGLVPTCTDVFSSGSGDRPHQIERRRDDVEVTAEQLIALGDMPHSITLAGVRTNLRVPLAYLSAWLGGRGAVAINHLMEDAATVEISRMQIWQWIRHGARMTGGFRSLGTWSRRCWPRRSNRHSRTPIPISAGRLRRPETSSNTAASTESSPRS